MNSIKLFTNEYRKHYEHIVKVADTKQLKHHLEQCRVVIDISSKVKAHMQIDGELRKKRLVLSKTKHVEGVRLENVFGTHLNCFA